VILTAASKLYGAAATWRRSWYASNGSRQRRLTRPVVSVGNLSVGGTGKTPTVAHLARLLAARGYQPDVLTRGYGRRAPASAITVVSKDSTVESTGDEPLMLARALAGVPVIVCADRYRAGLFAETLGTNLHLLDDGFQHLKLARDVDLVLVGDDDLTDRVLPAGRLREPLAAASAADAVIVPDRSKVADETIRRAVGAARSFRLRRTIGTPARAGTVFAVAGIARPGRFFEDLRAAGWNVAGTLAFPDHHPYTSGDIERIVRAARESGAAEVVTTEKDGVRFENHQVGGLAVTLVPLTVSIEPADEFAAWLVDRLAAFGHSGTR
jgi:tetraacyldisaccharide 4'-kinase